MESGSEAVRALLTRYAQGERQLVGVDLSGQSFSDCQLEGVMMAQGNFSGATMSNLTISLGRFFGSDFQAAIFSRCTFTSCQFQGSDFFGATFKDCLLAGCYFNESFLGASRFQDCMILISSLDDCVLFSADFVATNLDGFTLKGVEEATKKALGRINPKTNELFLLESSQAKNAVDKESLASTISLLQVRRQQIANLQTTRLEGREHYSEYAARRMSTLSSLEAFLRRTTLTTAEVKQFFQDYKRAAEVPSFFISYSFKDSEFVEMLEKRIGVMGSPVWFAPQKMQGGDTITEQLHRGIREADILVLVLSQNSLRSEWVFKEICEFYRHGLNNPDRRFYSVRIDATPVESFSLIDPHSGHDIGDVLRSHFIREFPDWRDPAKLSMAFDQMANDLGLDTPSMLSVPNRGAGATEKPDATRKATRVARSRVPSDAADAKSAVAGNDLAREPKRPRFFVSYSTQEVDLAEMIEKRLVARGCPVIFAPVYERFEDVDVFIVLLSAQSIKSKRVFDDVCRFHRLALADTTRRFYPIRADAAPFDGLTWIEPQSGRDLGQLIGSLFIRDFSHWRDAAYFSLAFDAMATDLDLGTIAQTFGRVADHPNRERFMTAGHEAEIMNPPVESDVAASPNSRADLLFELKRTVQSKEKGEISVPWFEQQERIFKELGDDGALKITVANKKMLQGDELVVDGKLDAALSLYKEAESLYRGCAHAEGLKFCLETQVLVIRQMRARQ